MNQIPLYLDPETLVKRRFIDDNVDIESFERRDYPGETIFVVYVRDSDFQKAARLGNDLDTELKAINFKGFVTVRKAPTITTSETVSLKKG